MDPTNILLALIAIALFLLVPIGCVMTKGEGGKSRPTAMH